MFKRLIVSILKGVIMATAELSTAVDRNTKAVNDLADRVANQPDQAAVDAATKQINANSDRVDSLVPSVPA